MLTRKQYELLMLIHDRVKSTGVPPSFDEMKAALGLKSKSGIHRLIVGLEERGFIRRLPHRARALEILKLPENITAPGDQAKSDTNVVSPGGPNVIQGDFAPAAPANSGASDTGHDVVTLPLWGRIAAGTPIEALRDSSATIDIPAGMLGRGEHYALEVDGDSMIEAGIHDGDTVVIEKCGTAENGAVVVALVDNEEVTLKKLRRKGASIALEPANVAFETRIFPPDRVKVQGRLVGLYRKY